MDVGLQYDLGVNCFSAPYDRCRECGSPSTLVDDEATPSIHPSIHPSGEQLSAGQLTALLGSGSLSASFIHYVMCNCTTETGYILNFEEIPLTSIRPALAAVIRAIRGSLGLTQEEMAQATSRTYLTKLEGAQSTPTLDKFVEVAAVLELSPLALMALVLATRDERPSAHLLAEAAEELRVLQERVSAEDIAAHLVGTEILKRPAARPADLEKLQKVQDCKRSGLTQAETARQLGISRSTVGFLWKRTMPAHS
ncbi:transcriptional regulator with XRE-family HTH domain [Pseudomonas sp. IAP-CY TE4608]